MEVTTALLCDHAQVRDGLLFVLSGGITRIRRPSYPAQLGAGFALALDLDRVEAESKHGLVLAIIGEDGEEVGRIAADIQVGDATGTYIGEHIQVPIAVDMRGALLPKPGAYELHVYVNGEIRRTVQFWAEETGEELV